MIACLMQEISELFSTVLLDFEHLTKHTIVPEGHFSKVVTQGHLFRKDRYDFNLC